MRAEQPARSAATWWRLPLLFAVVLVAIVAARSVQRRRTRTGASRRRGDAGAGSLREVCVRSSIDYGEGRERKFDAIPWHDGMNVDDVMIAASERPNGITYGVCGDHEMTLLNRIDDASNQWSGGNNWTYKVNDVPADRSMKVFELKPGDRVLWTFGRESRIGRLKLR